MSDWIVPVVSAVLALVGGVYATKGKRATDRGDLADRLVDQVQEERNQKVAELGALRAEKDGEITGIRSDLQRERELRHRDADYIVRLRRQVEGCGQTPEPYPGLDH